ncbi:hypothetical protein OSTOST_25508 [Ostertagia ostertagi]
MLSRSSRMPLKPCQNVWLRTQASMLRISLPNSTPLMNLDNKMPALIFGSMKSWMLERTASLTYLLVRNSL